MTSHITSISDRRERFGEALRGGIAVIPAATESLRNGDVHHSFRQASDFWFLTGFEEPDALVLIDPSAPEEQYVLFVRPKDREQEIWNGRREGVEGARERYGADAAYPIADFEAEVTKRLIGRSVLYAPLGHSAITRRLTAMINKVRAVGTRFGRPVPVELRDVAPLLGELRLRKTDAEITSLRQACTVSALGHAEAMRYTDPGMFEYEVQAALEYVFRTNGSMRNGYPSIVASGPNACILHHTENDRRVEDGDLLLIDAAAEVGYFSSDITRTFPVNGRFTEPQRAVYEVVLAAQTAALAECRPDATMRAVHDVAVDVIAGGLVDLGLLPGPVGDVKAMHHYREYYMHGTGHWIGLDVHDAGAYGVDGRPRSLEPSMAFTVEPGLYVDPDREVVRLSKLVYDVEEWTERRMMLGTAAAKKLENEERDAAGWIEHPVPEAFRGIGVRIEDDVLIDATGHENLTSGLPTDPVEIEALCAEPSALPAP
ncbi:MAG: aminopeptidase P N-terminal domain-containing protein [Acidimicrobiia bacterium]